IWPQQPSGVAADLEIANLSRCDLQNDRESLRHCGNSRTDVQLAMGSSHLGALAEACEANGVEAMFRSDHYLSASDETRPVLDAWATIAGLAARTTTLQLGTLVSPATFRHPAVLARNAATADEISGGRVTLGIGAGWMEREHAAYGFEFATAGERAARLAEPVEIVHRLLHDGRVDFAGKHSPP